MGNPYKTCGGCRRWLECDELANCRDLSLAWEDGYRAGLEAAAGKAITEHDALEETARGRSGWIRTITEERALVCAQLADEIRAMKGGQG